jgi:hypothetical protein
VAARTKLTDADVKRIRRRIRRGERQTALAAEFDVNRKTIRRRLDALERAEREQAERLAKKRLRRQVVHERRKLLEREQAAGHAVAAGDAKPDGRASASRQRSDPYRDWLDRPKNLSGRALAEANGLVRLARGGDRTWVERSQVEAYFEAGWVLEDRRAV